MEPEDNFPESGNNKRKLSDSEVEENESKKILLESSVSSTTLSTEVSTSSSTTGQDFSLPSSSGDVTESSALIQNPESIHDDTQMDIPSSSVAFSSEFTSKVESPSSSIIEDINIKEISFPNMEGNLIEPNESEISESPSDILSSNTIEQSSDAVLSRSTEENNMENQVVSSSDQFADVIEEEEEENDDSTSSLIECKENNDSPSLLFESKENIHTSALNECEENISQAEEANIDINNIEEHNKEYSKCPDDLEDKLNISSTTEGDGLKLVENFEILSEVKTSEELNEGEDLNLMENSDKSSDELNKDGDDSKMIENAEQSIVATAPSVEISEDDEVVLIDKLKLPSVEKIDQLKSSEAMVDQSECPPVEIFDQSECPPVEIFDQSGCSSAAVIDIDQSGCSSAAVIDIDQSGCSSAAVIDIDQSGCSSAAVIDQSECSSLAVIDQSECSVAVIDQSKCSSVAVVDASECPSESLIDQSDCPSVPVTDQSECSSVALIDQSECSSVAVSPSNEVDKDEEAKLIKISEDSSLVTTPSDELNLDVPQNDELNTNIPQSVEHIENVADSPMEKTKLSCTQEISDVSLSVEPESKENLTFEGTFKNISHSTDNDVGLFLKEKDGQISPVINESQDKKIDSSFVQTPRSDSPPVVLTNEPEVEQDKKSEVSAMEIDSINHTPIEESLANTPCDSGETSPSTSTPADSCQVSAAPSPVLKEDTTMPYDESSMDTKDVPEETEEDRELENIRPVRFGRRRKKKIFVPKYKRGRGKSTPMLVDEETRMSATGTPDIDEDSQSSVGTTSKREPRRYRSEVIVPESTATFTAEKVVEYMWPLEGGNGEHYFIQEHISQYLGIISFKRRYPDLRRRGIESQEKEYLKDLGLVTEIACDLGLTAVKSEDMLDIMFNDYPSKYEELQRVLRERKEKQFKEKGKVDYQIVGLDKSKMQEYSRKASLNASKWNAAFNRERFEERRYCFDLQTFSLHMPYSQSTRLSPSMTKMGAYPVAVLPGQYTDYCKRYTANELKGMPLQTVLAGPFTAEELAAEVQEDSDDDDGSAIASVGTCSEIKEEPDVPPAVTDPLSAEKQPRCKVCNGGRARNKDGKPEPLIICGTCRTASHPTCIDLTLTMFDKIEAYSWQCMDCKTCAQCNDPDDEERMIFCDMCDRGYHIYCVGLRRVPNGRWHCKECAICFTCGSRNPSGNEHIKNAEWQHEFKKDKANKVMKYACTLCMPCDKYWKRRQFCAVCMKVYRSIPEDGMVRCLGCPKYVHKDGCSILHENERYCNYCFKSRNKTALNHSRIIAAAKKKMATGSPIWK